MASSRQVEERGDTLIEILISIMILSFGVMGIYSALTGSLIAADAVRGRAGASQLVTQVADAIQLAEWECLDTPTESYGKVLERLKPTPSWSIAVTAMTHWGRSRSFEDGCPAPEDDAVFRTQKMMIVVKAPGARGQQTVELLKRP
jgi:hypothetical protein